MAVKFVLKNKEIQYKWDTEQYVKFRKFYYKIRDEQIGLMFDAFDNRAYGENFPSFVEQIVTNSVKKVYESCAPFFLEKKMYDFSFESFQDTYSYKRTLGPIRELIKKVRELIGNVDNYQAMEEARRDIRKAGRSRVGYLGAGFEGLVAGAVTTGVINGATGILHSAFNAIGNISTSIKASNMRDSIYRQFNEEVRESIYDVFEELRYAIISDIDIHVDIDWDKTNKILHNVENGIIPKDLVEDALIEALTEYPFSSKVYQAYMKLEDFNEQVERELLIIARYFGVDAIINQIEERHVFDGIRFEKNANMVYCIETIFKSCAALTPNWTREDIMFSYITLEDKDITNSFILRTFNFAILKKYQEIIEENLKRCTEENVDVEVIDYLNLKKKYFANLHRALDVRFLIPCKLLVYYRNELTDEKIKQQLDKIYIAVQTFAPEYKDHPWDILFASVSIYDKAGLSFIMTYDRIIIFNGKRWEFLYDDIEKLNGFSNEISNDDNAANSIKTTADKVKNVKTPYIHVKLKSGEANKISSQYSNITVKNFHFLKVVFGANSDYVEDDLVRKCSEMFCNEQIVANKIFSVSDIMEKNQRKFKEAFECHRNYFENCFNGHLFDNAISKEYVIRNFWDIYQHILEKNSIANVLKVVGEQNFNDIYKDCFSVVESLIEEIAPNEEIRSYLQCLNTTYGEVYVQNKEKHKEFLHYKECIKYVDTVINFWLDKYRHINNNEISRGLYTRSNSKFYKKLNGVMSYSNIIADEIVLFYDDTVFGVADKGFVITGDSIIFDDKTIYKFEEITDYDVSSSMLTTSTLTITSLKNGKKSQPLNYVDGGTREFLRSVIGVLSGKIQLSRNIYSALCSYGDNCGVKISEYIPQSCIPNIETDIVETVDGNVEGKNISAAGAISKIDAACVVDTVKTILFLGATWFGISFAYAILTTVIYKLTDVNLMFIAIVLATFTTAYVAYKKDKKKSAIGLAVFGIILGLLFCFAT